MIKPDGEVSLLRQFRQNVIDQFEVAIVQIRHASIVAIGYWADSSPTAQAIDRFPTARQASARETANPAKQIMPTMTIAVNAFSASIA